MDCLIAPAYWELLHFQRVLMQHAGIALGACALGYLVWKFHLVDAFSLPWNVGSRAFLYSVLALAFLCFAGVALLVLQDFPNSADEYSCVFLAKCFLAKKLYAATDVLQEFFHFTHIGEKDGKWFSVYPPGWPAMLCLGLAAGLPWMVNPLLAALTLVLLYRVALKIADARAAMLACEWIACSAFFLLYAGAYHSHMSCLFLLSAFAWCFVTAMEKPAGVAWFFLSGAILGYAMMTRYLTATAFGFPFGIFLLHRIFVRREGSWRDLVGFGLGLAIFNLVGIWFQYRVTGDPFLTPIHYYHEHERLGFSREFPPWLGLGYTVFRIVWYAEWVTPGLWLFGLSAYGMPGKSRWDKVFLWAALLSGCAYTLYYSFGGNQYGPRYHFESIGVLGILGAKAFFRFWDGCAAGRPRIILATGLLLAFAVNGWNVARDLRWIQHATHERKSLYRAVQREDLTHSVVFIRDWMGTILPLPPTDLTRNSPGRDDEVLYVRDLGDQNRRLMEAKPTRNFFVGAYDKGRREAVLLPVRLPVYGQSQEHREIASSLRSSQ